MRLFIVLGIVLAGALLIYSTLSISEYTATREKSLPPDAQGDSGLIVENTTSNIPPAKSNHSQVGSAIKTTPTALEGTEVPGSFTVDENGNLIITGDTKAIFDYFLLLQGTEQSTEQEILSLIENHLSEHLSGAALTQALQLLDRYMSYRNDLEDVMLGQNFLQQKRQFEGEYSHDQLTTVKYYYALVDELKGDYFSAHERDIFFSDEERYNRYMLQRMTIASSKVDQQEKQVQLHELDTQQNSSFIQQRHHSQALATIKNIRQNNVDIYAQQYALAEQFGEEKARSILTAEQHRATWQNKKSQYFALKKQLTEQHQYYSDADIGKLMDSYMISDLGFSDAEIIRMQMLEGRH